MIRSQTIRKVVILASALSWLGWALPGYAGLGQGPLALDAIRGAVQLKQQKSLKGTSLPDGVAVQEITTETETVVREYLDINRQVFAVTWQGPVKPDLRQLLGQVNFDQMLEHAGKNPHAGRSQLNLSGKQLVIQSGGTMRAYYGQAYLPGRIPSGFNLELLK